MEPTVAHEIPTGGLDLESDAHTQPTTAEPALYETIYMTTHKQPCRALAYSIDGVLSI
jgi:cleavage stimulation factor subunit 1